MTRKGILPIVAALLVASSATASAQTVLVRVLDRGTSTPVVGALAHVVGSEGRVERSALTDGRGRALFVGIPGGRYGVRVEMIGMATAETEPFELGEETTVAPVVRMESKAIELAGIDVELASDRCTLRPRAEGLLVAQLWDEARKALSAASFTDERGRYRYETMKYERQLDRDTRVVLREDRSRGEGFMRTPYESHPAEELVEHGFVRRDGRQYVYMAPDASVLLSDVFLDTHCFHIADPGITEDGLVGLGFRPTGDDKSVPDIAGTMWIDPSTAELQWLEYAYEYLEAEWTSPEVGGRVDFRRMPDGTWIVPEWWIRMPVMAMQTDAQGRPRPYIARYQQSGGLVLDVQEAGGRALGDRARTGGVEGIVVDSLGVPLRGIRVGVVGSSQEVFTGAEGEFSITGLPEGRYQLRFAAPRIEEMGHIPEPVTRDVVAGEMSYLEYHVSSMAEVLLGECRDVERDPESVILAGIVVDELGRPVSGANVRLQWNAYDFSGVPKGRQARDLREIPQVRETTASSTGSFSFCSVPAKSILRLSATSPSAESEELDLVIPEHEIGAVRVLELPSRR